ncbi:MAG: DUF4831 family protein [Bacteroidetes bacterium]|nr:DUF4831 family protein [Bacteroidota bacterium]
MKKTIFFAIMAVAMAGCIAPADMQVIVAPFGEEVPETSEQLLYALPQTVFKVELTYQEMKHIPGPFMEYAEKYLSIREVIRQNFSRWQILDVKITAHTELDPEMLFHLNVVEGEFNPALLEPFIEKGSIMDGSGLVLEELKSPLLETGVIRDYVTYLDLGIESNFEQRTETMYKTIVTDTSFVEVPVNRTITEQKSPVRKAQEAADFLLELRTRRFELLTGEYESFPQGEAMQAALEKLDEMESSYLSLFTGKTFGKTQVMEWFIIPESGSSSSNYSLGIFSELLGFVPEEIKEGSPLKIVMEPVGKTTSLNAYYTNTAVGEKSNVLYYRIPDVVNMKLMLGNAELASQRISVYQSGSLVTAPL